MRFNQLLREENSGLCSMKPPRSWTPDDIATLIAKTDYKDQGTTDYMRMFDKATKEDLKKALKHISFRGLSNVKDGDLDSDSYGDKIKAWKFQLLFDMETLDEKHSDYPAHIFEMYVTVTYDTDGIDLWPKIVGPYRNSRMAYPDVWRPQDKDKIIKDILKSIKQDDMSGAMSTYNHAKRVSKDWGEWPELDMVGKSLKK